MLQKREAASALLTAFRHDANNGVTACRLLDWAGCVKAALSPTSSARSCWARSGFYSTAAIGHRRTLTGGIAPDFGATSWNVLQIATSIAVSKAYGLFESLRSSWSHGSWGHPSVSFFHPPGGIRNGGNETLIYFAVFLSLAAYGAGALALDSPAKRQAVRLCCRRLTYP
jgi:hypothetical protein